MKNSAMLRHALYALAAVAACAAQEASAYVNKGTVALPNGLSARDLSLFPEGQYWRAAPVVRVKIENPTQKEQSVTVSFKVDTEYGSHYSDRWLPGCGKVSSKATVQPGASAVVELPVADAWYGWNAEIKADAPFKKSVILADNACSRPAPDSYHYCIYVPNSAIGEDINFLWNGSKTHTIPSHHVYIGDLSFTSAASCADPWPEDARAYMPFHAVFIELKQLSSISSGARAALRDYVAQGGLIFFIGATDLPAGFTESELFSAVPDPVIPDSCDKKTSAPDSASHVKKSVRSGYGTVAAIEKIPECNTAETDAGSKFASLSHSDTKTMAFIFGKIRNENGILSVTSDSMKDVYKAPNDSKYCINTAPFILLLTLFAVLFGPVALRILARRGARIHILWVLPAGSLLFCAAILFWITATEGSTPKIERHAVTFIDQRLGRALTTGSVTIRATHRLGSDLAFAKNSQVVPRGDFGGGSRSVEIDSAQRLVGRWAPARTPVSFAVRRLEADPRRVEIKFDGNGRPSAVNALGAALKELCVCNASGDAFIATDVAAGAALTPDDFMRTAPSSMIDSLDPNKTTDPGDTSKALPDLRCFYRAVIEDDCPFVEDPLEGRSARRSAKCTVYGTF